MNRFSPWSSFSKFVKLYIVKLRGHEYRFDHFISSGFSVVAAFVDDMSQAQIVVKFKETDEGRQEREIYRRLNDGKYQRHICHLLQYEEVKPDMSKILDPGYVGDTVSVLVMEDCGEPIGRYIEHCARKRMDEKQLEETVRGLFQQLCYGMKSLRNRGVVHRAISLDHVLVKEVDGNPSPELKIIGFTCSWIMRDDSSVVKGLGIPLLMAPENKPMHDLGLCDHKMDIWSAGILLMAIFNRDWCFKSLRSVVDPFDPDYTHPFMLEYLSSSHPLWSDKTVLETLSLMLVVDPQRRADWEEILESPWLIHGRKELMFDAGEFKECKLFTLPQVGRFFEGVVFKGQTKNGTPIAVERMKKAFFQPSIPFLDQKEKIERVKTERCNRMNKMIGISRLLQKSGSPNIIQLRGVTFDLSDDSLFTEIALAFEYLPLTLEERIRSGLSECECHGFMRDVVNGLRTLYDLGYIHGDICPNNILVRKYPDGREEAVLSGFFLAEKASELEGKGVFGRKGYIAPEAWNTKRAAPLMDIFSLGITMWEMLTGCDPRIGGTVGIDFSPLPFEHRTKVTSLCWETLKSMSRKNPGRRMTYDELWENQWLKASDEELRSLYIKEHGPITDNTMTDTLEEFRGFTELHTALLWPIGEDKKEIVARFQRTHDEILRKFEVDRTVRNLKIQAKYHACEGSFCEDDPPRAISEYNESLLNLHYARILSVADEQEIRHLGDVVNTRLFKVENRFTLENESSA